jgi:hypothetical protein
MHSLTQTRGKPAHDGIVAIRQIMGIEDHLLHVAVAIANADVVAIHAPTLGVGCRPQRVLQIWNIYHRDDECDVRFQTHEVVSKAVSHANDVIQRHRRKLLFQLHTVPPTHLPDSVEAPLDYRPRT